MGSKSDLRPITKSNILSCSSYFSLAVQAGVQVVHVNPKDLFQSPQPSKEALGYIYRCHQGITWLAKINIGGKIEISNTKLLDLLLTFSS
jgi:hypothetical protein